jgi:hypothetical protein
MKKLAYNLLILAVIVWLGLITVMLLRTLKQPKIGLVDAQLLITNQAQKIASLYPNDNLPPEKLLQLAEQIKSSVETHAKNNNIILLAKGAVWGGKLPDYTENIIAALKEE